jgi:uncharacterized protein
MQTRLTIVDDRSGAVLARRANLCDSPLSRFCGLMLRAKLPESEGVILSPCNSVHMALMRFAIDLVYLDKENRIVKIIHGLKPYRISLGGFRAHAAIELPAGTLDCVDAQPGDLLQMIPDHQVLAGSREGT